MDLTLAQELDRAAAPVCQGPVGQEVQHLLVGVILAAQEDQVLQGVGQPIIVQGL